MATTRFAHRVDLDPQYELDELRRKFRLTEAEARAFLEIAGTDR